MTCQDGTLITEREELNRFFASIYTDENPKKHTYKEDRDRSRVEYSYPHNRISQEKSVWVETGFCSRAR